MDTQSAKPFIEDFMQHNKLVHVAIINLAACSMIFPNISPDSINVQLSDSIGLLLTTLHTAKGSLPKVLSGH